MSGDLLAGFICGCVTGAAMMQLRNLRERNADMVRRVGTDVLAAIQDGNSKLVFAPDCEVSQQFTLTFKDGRKQVFRVSVRHPSEIVQSREIDA